MMNAALGVFDSGLGGLTVLKEILRELPGESVIYFGDTARVPYGTKSRETITRFSMENLKFLQTFGIKAAVIACHTASSLALDAVRGAFGFPIVGVVAPGAAKAAAATKNGRIGVIGTRSTVESHAYENAILERDPAAKVVSAACPLFVPLAEEGMTEGDIVRQIVAQYLVPVIDYNVDTLVLGCTHYPVLLERILEVLPPGITVVNPAVEAARDIAEVLKAESLEAPGHHRHDTRYFVSDEPSKFVELGPLFLGRPITRVERVVEEYGWNLSNAA
ncbi:MAG: glutamate racemase [Candidatus Omnitrophica bacterium]|nr:glutamate racemase [Candidatus Omnitrophota bacterium]